MGKISTCLTLGGFPETELTCFNSKFSKRDRVDTQNRGTPKPVTIGALNFNLAPDPFYSLFPQGQESRPFTRIPWVNVERRQGSMSKREGTRKGTRDDG